MTTLTTIASIIAVAGIVLWAVAVKVEEKQNNKKDGTP